MTSNQWSRRSTLRLIGAAGLAPVVAGTGTLQNRASAQSAPSARSARSDLDARIQEIVRRPEFPESRWGMRFQLLGSDRPVYTMNSDQLFTTGSSFKVFPGGTAFSTLGPDYRFRTRVYRAGPVAHGVLRGDLILVASGDLLIGGRIRRDGSLALPDPDHSYGSVPLPGDPIQGLREIAAQVRRAGIRRIEGRVRVDASLFRKGYADIALGGLKIPVVPMMTNDNLVDVTVTPGRRAGQPARLRLTPDIGYVDVRNEVVTVASPEDARPLAYADETERPDGTRTVRLTGAVPLDGGDMYRPYYLQDPVRYAELAFTEALRDACIKLAETSSPSVDAADAADAADLRRYRTPGNQVAVRVSPPLSEAIKVMLKVSSNIHTAYFPYLVGAIAGHDAENPKERGERFQHALLRSAGLDPEPAGSADHKYAPDYFVPYLTYLTSRSFFPQFHAALPIMGRDGTLSDVQVDSPAAGHVFAKTGSAGGRQPDGRSRIAKALAGYIELPGGRTVAFTEFMETYTEFGKIPSAGEALGEIATAVYEELA
ncbi:MAG: D-alanyl-D-alanine carboxypeptidase/D-alanyl-D-alanine endopeptidase [Spirillospora sp.]